MRDLFIFFWGAILTTCWWIFASISTPISEWYDGFCILFVLFLFANLSTLAWIVVILMITVSKSWESI